MAIYAIGDVHGCYSELKILLTKINFDPDRDLILFVGDLINRGPDSNSVIDLVRAYPECMKSVLGNHDISLLAYQAGLIKKSSKHFDEILNRNDADEVLSWFTSLPLLIDLPELNTVIVHAGLPPTLGLTQCRALARFAESVLKEASDPCWLRFAYSAGEDVWSDDFSDIERFRYALNAFTRIRFCHANGRLNFSEKGPLGSPGSDSLKPWFTVRECSFPEENQAVMFGHWAALGYHSQRNVVCLDSGCAWGGRLTAIRLDASARQTVQVESLQTKTERRR